MATSPVGLVYIRPQVIPSLWATQEEGLGKALLVTKLCSSCAVSVLSSVTAMWGNPCLHMSFASWSPAKPTLLKLESHLKHRFGY